MADDIETRIRAAVTRYISGRESHHDQEGPDAKQKRVLRADQLVYFATTPGLGVEGAIIRNVGGQVATEDHEERTVGFFVPGGAEDGESRLTFTVDREYVTARISPSGARDAGPTLAGRSPDQKVDHAWVRDVVAKWIESLG